jgi:hypothetical protein
MTLLTLRKFINILQFYGRVNCFGAELRAASHQFERAASGRATRKKQGTERKLRLGNFLMGFGNGSILPQVDACGE